MECGAVGVACGQRRATWWKEGLRRWLRRRRSWEEKLDLQECCDKWRLKTVRYKSKIKEVKNLVDVNDGETNVDFG